MSTGMIIIVSVLAVIDMILTISMMTKMSKLKKANQDLEDAAIRSKEANQVNREEISRLNCEIITLNKELAIAGNTVSSLKSTNNVVTNQGLNHINKQYLTKDNKPVVTVREIDSNVNMAVAGGVGMATGAMVAAAFLSDVTEEEKFVTGGGEFDGGGSSSSYDDAPTVVTEPDRSSYSSDSGSSYSSDSSSSSSYSSDSSSSSCSDSSSSCSSD
jgi:hypothetical protein